MFHIWLHFLLQVEWEDEDHLIAFPEGAIDHLHDSGNGGPQGHGVGDGLLGHTRTGPPYQP